jgi:Sulfatase
MADLVQGKSQNSGCLFLVILSLVNCYFLPEWANFWGDRLTESFLLTPTPLIHAYFVLPLVVLMVAVAMYLTVLTAAKCKLHTLEKALYLLLFVGLLVPLNYLREYFALFNYYPVLSHGVHLILDPLIGLGRAPWIVLAIVVLVFLSQKISLKLISLVRLIGGVLSPIVLVTCLNHVYAFYRGYNSIPTNRKIAEVSKAEASKRIKIAWIIFDEMDYRLAFSERPAGVKLPALDRFRKESIFAEAAYPPSDYTIHSIPSLLVGEKVDVTKVEPSDLLLQEKYNGNQIKKWTEFSNVFREAKSLGYTTALIGWYHTYCRVFKDDLDYCRRLPAGRFGYGQDFWGSVKAILSRSVIFDRRLERAFVFNLNEIKEEGLRKIQEDQYDFVFLHFTVPHAPWIQDPETNQLSSQVSREPKNYLKNLELADKIFSEIRRKLEDQNNWDRAMIIVSSDHFWRKSEQYDGKKDFRVPLFINMQDNKGMVFKEPIASVVTKDLIVDVMKKKVVTTEDAMKWLSERSKTFPSGTVLVSPKGSVPPDYINSRIPPEG